MSDPQQTPNPQQSGKSCPECSAEMAPVYLIDRGHGNSHKGLEYAAEEGWWPFRLPSAGKVHAFMCSECGRILLYGYPHGAPNPPTGSGNVSLF